MFCAMCGGELDPGSDRCGICGTPAMPPIWVPPPPEEVPPAEATPVPEQPPEAPAPLPETPGPLPETPEVSAGTAPEEEAPEAPPVETAAPAEAPPAKQRKKRPFPWRWLVRAVLLAAAAGILSLALFLPGRYRAFRFPGHSWQVLEDAGKWLVLQDGAAVAELEAEPLSLLTGLSGDICALQTREGDVYLLREGERLKVADRVYCMALSGDGSALACVTESLELELYDTGTLASSRVAKRVYGVSLSPDGDALAYYTMDTDGTTTAWLYDGKKSEKLGEDRIPFALSNGGRYVYCRSDHTGDLYVIRGGDSLRLASDMDPEQGVQLNADHTQLMFTAGDGICISRFGKEAVHLGEGTLELILPRGSAPVRWMGSGFVLTTLPVSGLGGRFYTDGSGIFWMSLRCRLHSLAEQSLQVQVSADGKRLAWLDEDGQLWTAEQGALALSRLLAADVTAFTLTSESDGVWFTDSLGTLWYRELRGVARLVSEDARAPVLTHDGRCLFFTGWDGTAGVLWECRAGSAPRELLRAKEVSCLPTATVIFGEDGGLYSLGKAGCEPLRP